MNNLVCRGALIPALRVERLLFLQVSFHWRLGDMINVDHALTPDTVPLLIGLKDTASKQHAAIGLAGYLPRRLTQEIAAFNEGGGLANLLVIVCNGPLN